MPEKFMFLEVYSSEPAKGSKNAEQRIGFTNQNYIYEKLKTS
jgi:hypothetical protein